MNIKNMNLDEFLNYKTIYYDKINLSFIQEAWKILSTKIKLPFVIHIIGTNGKGSTGRFLAHYLNKKHYKTLHYSSPHILKFNERIWINGADVSDEDLENAHKFLQNLYETALLEKLTYFEYTTLLALYLSNNFDYLILEAGLGGEFDATNVVQNNISLVTTIAYDHIAFLGDSIEKIATTKMRSVDNKMIIGFQLFDEVIKTAKKIKNQIKKEKNKDIEILELKDFSKYELKSNFAKYLKRNLHLAIACLEELKIPIDLKLFDDTRLFGRCQRVLRNVTIDVGHNSLAACVLFEEFKDKKVNLIYNSYMDKDYKEILSILKPIIKTISIIPLDDKRAVQKDELIKVINELNLKQNPKIELKNDEEYLVFGSFLVVEKFLKTFYDRNS